MRKTVLGVYKTVMQAGLGTLTNKLDVESFSTGLNKNFILWYLGLIPFPIS